jgi:signal transduction histidine kinase
MGPDPTFLLVDERADDRALAALSLRRVFPGSKITEVGDAIAFAEALAGSTHDVIISELDLSWGSGDQVLAAARRRNPDCLTFLFSAAAAARVAATSLPLNLDGHLCKDSSGYLRLPDAVQAAMDAAAARRELAGARISEELASRARTLERSNQELEQVTYALSHDMQEPLQLVARHARLLADRYKTRLDREAETLLNHLVGSTARMQEMIDAVLDYARVGSDGRRPEAIDLGGLVDGVLAGMQPVLAAAGAIVDRQPLPTVSASRRQLEQLFRNLIGNAVKFRGAETPRIRIAASDVGPLWRVTVSDNGIGIDPADLPRLFRMFRRLHTREEFPGTGIGLAICKRIVEAHGGTITVESARGKGASFHVNLPKEPPP